MAGRVWNKTNDYKQTVASRILCWRKHFLFVFWLRKDRLNILNTKLFVSVDKWNCCILYISRAIALLLTVCMCTQIVSNQQLLTEQTLNIWTYRLMRKKLRKNNILCFDSFSFFFFFKCNRSFEWDWRNGKKRQFSFRYGYDVHKVLCYFACSSKK